MPSRPTRPQRKESMPIAQVGALREAFEIRGQWRIRRTELERWMDEQPSGGGDGDA